MIMDMQAKQGILSMHISRRKLFVWDVCLQDIHDQHEH